MINFPAGPRLEGSCSYGIVVPRVSWGDIAEGANITAALRLEEILRTLRLQRGTARCAFVLLV